MHACVACWLHVMAPWYVRIPGTTVYYDTFASKLDGFDVAAGITYATKRLAFLFYRPCTTTEAEHD